MHLVTTGPNGARLALNLDAVVSATADGGLTGVRHDVEGQDPTHVHAGLDALAAMPGFLRVGFVRPHGPPVDSALNLAFVTLAVPAEEGTLVLLRVRAEPRRLLLDLDFAEYVEALRRVSGAAEG